MVLAAAHRFEDKMKRVYVAGPYTKGDVAQNVRNAYAAAGDLADAGLSPFVPHHTHFWHMLFPREYESWLELDEAWVERCEYLLRLPGPSNGADKEVARAQLLGIPVYYTVADLVAAARSAGHC